MFVFVNNFCLIFQVYIHFLSVCYNFFKVNSYILNIKGDIDFKETKDGILLTAKVRGLPKSTNKCTERFFGFHIHEGSSCTGNIKDEIVKADFSLYITL